MVTADDATPNPSQVLSFWFGDGLELGWPSTSKSDVWWNQDECVKRFGQLHQDGPEAHKAELLSNLKFAQGHRDIIARFGRFPYRNAVLGRINTALEDDFIKTGPRFGQ